MAAQYDQLQMVNINPTKYEQNLSNNLQGVSSTCVTGQTQVLLCSRPCSGMEENNVMKRA